MKKYISTLALAALACNFAQAQYANQTLSNLSPTTAVNQTLLPGTSGTLSLGFVRSVMLFGNVGSNL